MSRRITNLALLALALACRGSATGSEDAGRSYGFQHFAARTYGGAVRWAVYDTSDNTARLFLSSLTNSGAARVQGHLWARAFTATDTSMALVIVTGDERGTFAIWADTMYLDLGYVTWLSVMRFIRNHSGWWGTYAAGADSISVELVP